MAGEPDGVPFPVDAGDVDLTIAPSGFPNGYDDLIAGSVVVDLGDGGATRIAALRDVIASKQAAGRARDIAALPYLRALADELER